MEGVSEVCGQKRCTFRVACAFHVHVSAVVLHMALKQTEQLLDAEVKWVFGGACDIQKGYSGQPRSLGSCPFWRIRFYISFVKPQRRILITPWAEDGEQHSKRMRAGLAFVVTATLSPLCTERRFTPQL